MSPISRGRALPLLPFLLCLLTVLGVVAAGEPEVVVSRFKTIPSKLFYFEDSSVSSPAGGGRLRSTPNIY